MNSRSSIVRFGVLQPQGRRPFFLFVVPEKILKVLFTRPPLSKFFKVPPSTLLRDSLFHVVCFSTDTKALISTLSSSSKAVFQVALSKRGFLDRKYDDIFSADP